MPLLPRPRRLGPLILLLFTAALLSTGLVVPHIAAATADTATVRPTVVLVHGAFTDSSSWTAVTERLQADGYPVVAVANPLRDLAADTAYLASVLNTIKGKVVLVGHSYGGSVISNIHDSKVQALVYVAAFAPRHGEDTQSLGALGGGHSQLPASLLARPLPGGGPQDVDLYVDPSKFRAVIAADLPARVAGALAAQQRPASAKAFAGVTGTPAWATTPSWFLISRDDQAIPVQAQRVMAARAHGTVVEVAASHLVMISHPDAVTEIIETASR